MPPRPPRTLWQHARNWFRRFRILGWLSVLAVVCAVIYLGQVGLPEFLKRPLLDQLRLRGIELEYTRLRLAWQAGIVAEEVRFSPAGLTGSPKLSARMAELDLDWRELLRGRVDVDALGLRGGRFEWPINESNAPPRTLSLENISARLRLLPDDEWALEDFRAQFAGARLFLSGTITNASAIRQWEALGFFPQSLGGGVRTKPGDPGTARRRLRVFAETLERTSFSTPPELRLLLTGDARDPQTFALRLSATAPDAETPWGTVQGARLNGRLFAATASQPSRVELTFAAAETHTPWADASQFELQFKLGTVKEKAQLVDGDLTLRAASARTRWANSTNTEFRARWIHSLTNPIPLSGRGELRAGAAFTKWASGREVRLEASLATATNPPAADASWWAWWTNLLRYQVTWEAGLEGLQTRQLVADKVACAGSWLAPELAITNLHATMFRGTLEARGRLDVPTRAASVELESSLDLQSLGPLLPDEARRWLGIVSWTEPPRLRGGAAFTLPAWTNRQPDWRGEVLPTLCLAGDLVLTNATCEGLTVDWGRSRFTHTNALWELPNLEVARPDGQLLASGQASARTKDFHARIRSTLPPELARPFLGTNGQRGLDFFTFTVPPVIDAEVWGRFGSGDRLALRGNVAMTNFTFRGTPVTAFTSGLAYSNRVLEGFEPRVWRDARHLRAAGVMADFTTQRVHFTNVFSTDDPMVVTRAIGPKTARAIEPYQFAEPPTVRLEGTVPMRGNEGADLRVEVEGGPFAWWKFHLPQIRGSLRWQNNWVTLTNVTAAFYGGRAQGWGVFDATPGHGTDCRFAATATNADFHAFMSDLTTPTNRLEGTFDATLTVTRGNSDDWRTWNGYGDVRLRDGWIWAIPVFGVLSAPLDSIVPGLGTSRVSSGSGQFFMNNGVVSSDDLEWRAPMMRLQYNAAVDLLGNVNATVQAELLRDTWLVGRLVSLALWPVTKVLEFKVTGTLSEPKAEPLYIPKLLTAPLRPWQTFRELFSERPNGTNAPPAQSQPQR